MQEPGVPDDANLLKKNSSFMQITYKAIPTQDWIFMYLFALFTGFAMNFNRLSYWGFSDSFKESHGHGYDNNLYYIGNITLCLIDIILGVAWMFFSGDTSVRTMYAGACFYSITTLLLCLFGGYHLSFFAIGIFSCYEWLYVILTPLVDRHSTEGSGVVNNAFLRGLTFIGGGLCGFCDNKFGFRENDMHLTFTMYLIFGFLFFAIWSYFLSDELAKPLYRLKPGSTFNDLIAEVKTMIYNMFTNTRCLLLMVGLDVHLIMLRTFLAWSAEVKSLGDAAEKTAAQWIMGGFITAFSAWLFAFISVKLYLSYDEADQSNQSRGYRYRALLKTTLIIQMFSMALSWFAQIVIMQPGGENKQGNIILFQSFFSFGATDDLVVIYMCPERYAFATSMAAGQTYNIVMRLYNIVFNWNFVNFQNSDIAQLVNNCVTTLFFFGCIYVYCFDLKGIEDDEVDLTGKDLTDNNPAADQQQQPTPNGGDLETN